MKSTKTKKIKLIKNCNRCGEELCCYRGIGTFCPTGYADYQIESKGELKMNIKVGDKVRIKTEEELLADGFVKDGENLYCSQTGRYFANEMRDYCGQIVTIAHIWSYLTIFEFNIEEDDGLWSFDETMIVDACKPILQTLDEYICSLPLEERAKWFITEYIDPEWRCTIYLSTITHDEYRDYGEAQQATIEALKGERK